MSRLARVKTVTMQR